MQTAEFTVTEKTPEFQHRCYSSSVVSSDDLEKDMIPSEGTRDGINFLKMDRHTSVSTAAPGGRTHRKHWH